jgi:hypothetical protein
VFAGSFQRKRCIELRGHARWPLKRILSGRYRSLQTLIEAAPLGAVMDFTVTIRAHGSHEARVIRTAISKSTNVVRLQVWSTIH